MCGEPLKSLMVSDESRLGVISEELVGEARLEREMSTNGERDR